MVSRKLLLNNGSFYVNIPKKIVNKYNLTENDEVEITDDDSSLKITPKTKIFSIGYEGKSADDFINNLKNNGINIIFDVRENAFSFKKGFSRSQLSKKLKDNNILYINIFQLGAPKDVRDPYKKNGYQDFNIFKEGYKEHMNNNYVYVNYIYRSALNNKVALMCFEKEWQKCHRSLIEESLEENGLDVIHI